MNARFARVLIGVAILGAGCKAIEMPMYSNADRYGGAYPFVTNPALIEAGLANPMQCFDFSGMGGERWRAAKEIEAIARSARARFRKGEVSTVKHDEILAMGEMGFVIAQWFLSLEGPSEVRRGGAEAAPLAAMDRIRDPEMGKVIADAIARKLDTKPPGADEGDQILKLFVAIRDAMKRRLAAP